MLRLAFIIGTRTEFIKCGLLREFGINKDEVNCSIKTLPHKGSLMVVTISDEHELRLRLMFTREELEKQLTLVFKEEYLCNYDENFAHAAEAI